MMWKQPAEVLNYPECPSAPAGALKNVANSKDNGVVFDPHRFKFNGSVTTRVFMDGEVTGSENDLVMAYVDGS
jgi:hypothetical protein